MSEKKTTVHCRFHTEITPSMVLNHADNTFHCIGCGAEGTFKENKEETGFLFTRNAE